jgi:hypothetical protein
MSNQAQCPNCGGYKVDGILTQIDPETGKAIGASNSSAGCWIFAIVVIIAVVILASGSVEASRIFLVIVQVSSLLALVLAIPYAFWSAHKTKQARKRAHNYFSFSCNLCGYKWQWREGTPLPKVKVQPDLIAAGAIRWEQQVAAIKCKACGNTILEGQSHCAFCGASR